MKYFMILSMMYLIDCDSVVQAKLPNKLSNGRPTTLTAHPHHVSVYFHGHVMCAGTIIGPRHILTSASCVLLGVDVMITAVGNLYVLTGSSDVHDTRSLREFHQVYAVIWHKNYMPREFWGNDIAILQLEEEITFLATRSSIALPLSYLRYKKKFIVANWGTDQSSTNDDKCLQYIHVSGQTNSDCRKIFPEFSLNYKFQSCGKTVFFQSSAMTFGDSGAALVYAFQVNGIVTAFSPDKPQFVIYTKVYPYIDFIVTALTIY